jgi:SAM-dependent methyltransferase
VTPEFGPDYWERHWAQGRGSRGRGSPAVPGHASPGHAAPERAEAGDAPNPYLIRETSGLAPGTALDAGCGAGAEAIWLASRGWQVTAADIASAALARAASRAEENPAAGLVRWVQADLTSWDPGTRFGLVTTSYAHPAMAQLAFYQRISAWVAPGGTLLIVGHRHAGERAGPGGHAGHPAARASVTAADITAVLDDAEWEIVTAGEPSRTLAGHPVPLRDAVVRATRRPAAAGDLSRRPAAPAPRSGRGTGASLRGRPRRR